MGGIFDDPKPKVQVALRAILGREPLEESELSFLLSRLAPALTREQQELLDVLALAYRASRRSILELRETLTLWVPRLEAHPHKSNDLRGEQYASKQPSSPGGPPMWKLAFVLVLACLPIGCVSQVVKDKAVLNEAISRSFVGKMDQGATERKDEQDFIREQARAWTAFRDSLGLKEAK